MTKLYLGDDFTYDNNLGRPITQVGVFSTKSLYARKIYLDKAEEGYPGELDAINRELNLREPEEFAFLLAQESDDSEGALDGREWLLDWMETWESSY